MAIIGKTFEERLWNFFMPLIKNAYGVSALAGNWRAECGNKANNLQNSFQKKLGHTDESYTAAVDDGTYTNFVYDGAGYGTAQWTHWSRKQGLLNYAKQKRVSIGNEEMMFEYAWKELSTGYKTVLAVMKAAKSVKEASDVILTKYEQPKDQGETAKATRTAYGEEFYKKYTGANNVSQNGGKIMDIVRIGSAQIDERGKASGGTAGDQKQVSSVNDTVGEVSIQDMYAHSKGWLILRPKQAAHAGLMACKMIEACNNANIGYDQGNRLGIITYGVASKIKTECDCSSLVRECVKEATGKDPGNFTTSNEADKLEATGLFEKRQSYVSQAKTPLYNGDVLVTKTKGHTAIVTNGNPRVDVETANTGNTMLSTKLQPAKSKDRNLLGTYEVTTSLNLLHGPDGEKFAILVEMPKGTKFRCYGYYTMVSNTIWLYGIATINGRQYTGFANMGENGINLRKK